MDAPKKQGKMFHIELGQNEGPFRVKDLAMKTQSIMMKKRPMTPEGAYELLKKSVRENHSQELAANSVKEAVTNIEASLNRAYDLIDDYQKEAQVLKVEIKELTEELTVLNDDILKDLHPDIGERYQGLKQEIRTQKDENEQLNKQLAAMKKEESVMQQKLLICITKISKLENHIGVLDPSKSQQNLLLLQAQEQLHSSFH